MYIHIHRIMHSCEYVYVYICKQKERYIERERTHVLVKVHTYPHTGLVKKTTLTRLSKGCSLGKCSKHTTNHRGTLGFPMGLPKHFPTAAQTFLKEVCVYMYMYIYICMQTQTRLGNIRTWERFRERSENGWDIRPGN